MIKKKKKKFVIIGKVGNRPDGVTKWGTAICFKHWTNNIDNYLNKVMPKYNFMWANFYYNDGELKGKQFATWTKTKGFNYYNKV